MSDTTDSDSTDQAITYGVSFVYIGEMGLERYEEITVSATSEEQAVEKAKHHSRAPDEYERYTVSRAHSGGAE